MARNSKRGKCPECCPDGGAIFSLDFDADLNRVWQCNNCGYQKPVSRLKPLDKPSPGMQRTIDRLHAIFGGTVEVTMQDRRAWVKLSREASWHETGRAFGIVNCNGTFKLTVMQFGGDKEITDWIGAEVYLASKEFREQQAAENKRSLERLEATL